MILEHRRIICKKHISKLTLNCGPGQVAQLVRALTQYTKVVGSIPSQGTYKEQQIYVSFSPPFLALSGISKF